MKRIITTLLSVLAIVAALMGIGTVAFADGHHGGPDPTQVCANSGGGWQTKIDVGGEQGSLTVTAPQGQLIAAYCVSGGHVRAMVVPVNPPAASVTISTGAKYAISHYQVMLVPASTSTPTPTPTVTPSVTPSVTPGVTPSVTPSVTPIPSPSVTPTPGGNNGNNGNNGGNNQGDNEAPDDVEVLGEQASSNNPQQQAPSQAVANQPLPTTINAGAEAPAADDDNVLSIALVALGALLGLVAFMTRGNRPRRTRS